MTRSIIVLFALSVALVTLTANATSYPTLIFKNQFGEQTNAHVLGGTMAGVNGTTILANTIVSNLTSGTALPVANTYTAVATKLMPVLPLTGYAAGAGSVSSSDTVLAALQKLDGNGQQGGALVSSTVTLSAAQVIALNATPITIIPLVASKTIRVVECKLAYAKGSAAFTIGTGSDNFLIQYHVGAVAVGTVLQTGLIDQASATRADVMGPGVGGIGLAGSAVEITSNSTDTTVGTGSTVAVTCLYSAY